MKKALPFVLQMSICIFTLMMLMWISSWKSLSINNATFSSAREKAHPISLPFSRNFVGNYTIGIKVDNASGYTREFRIIPDDEIVAIRVNGEPVSIDHIPHSDRRNFGSGFVMDIDKLKTEETNSLEFDMINSNNPAGFRISATQLLSTSQFIGILTVLTLFAVFLKKTLRISHLQLLFLVSSIFISVVYLSKTDSHTRTFDVYEGGGHKDYIEHLITHKNLPNPGEGWEYHQPPLYYLIAATTKVAGNIFEQSSDLWAQLLALYFWVIFLVSGLACLHIAFRKQLAPLVLSSLALCLWPAGIIHSIRIGNDLCLYAFFGLSFFYTLKWWKTRSSWDLGWAAIWMGASLLTKSNGLAMTATLGILFLVHMLLTLKDKEHFQHKKQKLVRDFSMLSVIVATAFLLNFGDNIYFYLKGASSDWLLSNVSQTINAGLKVGNEPQNYLIFDSATFLLHPFISTWEDSSGRQYFWNFVWRSSLSSEFSFPGEALKYWGISNGILLLFVLAGIAIYFLQEQPFVSRKTLLLSSYKHLPWILTLILPFLLLLAYRIKVPLSCNTDFRYIYPVLTNIIFFACLAWKKPKTFPIPAIFALGLALIAANSVIWISLLRA